MALSQRDEFLLNSMFFLYRPILFPMCIFTFLSVMCQSNGSINPESDSQFSFSLIMWNWAGHAGPGPAVRAAGGGVLQDLGPGQCDASQHLVHC